MVDFHLNETDCKCIRLLAALFQRNITFLRTPLEDLVRDGLQIDADSYPALMGVMEQCGAIQDPLHADAMRYWAFTISPNVIQLSRQIEAARKKEMEPGDIVSQISEKARKNPWIAWLIIAVIVLGGTMTFVNQAADFLARLGIVKDHRK